MYDSVQKNSVRAHKNDDEKYRKPEKISGFPCDIFLSAENFRDKIYIISQTNSAESDALISSGSISAIAASRFRFIDISAAPSTRESDE